jgi:DNA-binding transcriptional ArsR family regulator
MGFAGHARFIEHEGVGQGACVFGHIEAGQVELVERIEGGRGQAGNAERIEDMDRPELFTGAACDFRILPVSSSRPRAISSKDAPLTTGALCERFGEMDRCTVMQHLKVLEEAELIVARREGRERWNHLNALPIQAIHDRWISQYAGHAMNVLSALKGDLED